MTFANHDETVDGELSDDPMNPTVIQVVNGSNEVCASAINPDRDFYTITVPPGATLDEIVLTSFSSLNVGFLGFTSGNTIDPDAGQAGLLGFTLLGLVSGPQLAELNTSIDGFDIPLGPGDYTFWTQETSNIVPTSYCLDFQLTIPQQPSETAIPTMGEWGVIILGLLLLILSTNHIYSSENKRLLPKKYSH